MTVAGGLNIKRFDGNGSAENFAFPYIFVQDSDLVVTHTDISDVDTILVLDTDYTVTGEGTPSSGNVFFPKVGSSFSTLATGEQLTVERQMPLEEDTDLSGSYQFSTLNDSKDAAMMILQDIKGLLNRAALYDATNPDAPPRLETIMAALGNGAHAALLLLGADDHTQYSLISSGNGAPGSTPSRVGEIYVDTTGDIAYVSTDTASSADWDKIGFDSAAFHNNINSEFVNVPGGIKVTTVDNDVLIIEDFGASFGKKYITMSSFLSYIATNLTTFTGLTSIISNGSESVTVEKLAGGLKGTITVIFDGGGATLTTGAKNVYVSMPHAGTITEAILLADQSGSIVVDVWLDSYANFPPTDADSITAAAPPTITAATKSTDSTLTGWTKTFITGDIFECNIDSVTTLTKCILILKYDITSE